MRGESAQFEYDLAQARLSLFLESVRLQQVDNEFPAFAMGFLQGQIGQQRPPAPLRNSQVFAAIGQKAKAAK